MPFLKLAVIGLVFALGLSTAQAQLVRTFVATYGSDSNPCTPDAPCRTFPVAINATSAGGTVIALNSGGYGSDITIAKSISIVAPEGIVAQIRSSGIGVLVNGSGISVTLRGLSISGSGTGVRFAAGNNLSLQKLAIQSSSSAVENQNPTGLISVSHTSVDNSYYGFYAGASSSGQAAIAIDNSSVTNAYIAYYAGQGSFISVKQSVARGRSKTATICYANFLAVGAGSYLSADDVQSTGCNVGFFASDSSFMSVSNALINGNAFGGTISATGQAASFGNNRAFGNGNDALTGFTTAAQR